MEPRGRLIPVTGAVILFGLLMALTSMTAATVPVAQPSDLASLPADTPIPSRTPTPTFTPSPTPSWTPPPAPTVTPTSMPGPPTLLSPENDALIPQPVLPNQWYFKWDARTGPCWCTISIGGPGGRSLYSGIDYQLPGGYHFVYTQTDYLPDDALGPWRWSVAVDCPQGHNYSETHTFRVMPAAWFFNFKVLLPLILKDG